MATKIWLTACAAMAFSVAVGQNQYDAERMIGHELNGTARFVGMGGAMSALGGDMSVMGTNPAGIGLYRSSDAAVSFGFHNRSTKSNFNGTSMSEKETKASFDQAGFVFSMKYGNNTSLRYMNFGFNYKKSKDFSQLFSAGGDLDGYSQSWQIANSLELSNKIQTFDEFDKLRKDENPYRHNENKIDILGIMAARTGVVDFQNKELLGWNGIQNKFYSEESGGIYQYDFNMAFNIEDRFYLGATLGYYDVDYRLTSSYEESFGWNNQYVGNYRLDNYYRQTGGGIDFKLGFILRPFENDPFRLGFAVHTPTWYNIRESYDAVMLSHFNSEKPYEERLSYYLNDDYLIYDYNLITPWKFNVSMGTTLGGIVALGAEWEYQDYSTAKFKDTDGYNLPGSNSEVKQFLKGVHTLRVGMESRLGDSGMSLRAGYNYSTASFKSDSDNFLANYSTRTDYMNSKEKQTITFGLGYKGRLIYADLAYKYDVYKSEFSPFTDSFDGVKLSPTKVDNERHQMVFTLGARF
ncbi:MAG: hypothetical protein ACRCZZ_03185 [Phocaeicola sp.]